MEPIIRVGNFSKIYGSFRAVDNISFEVERGSTFAFLGTNGAGKSTTLSKRQILQVHKDLIKKTIN